MSYKNPIRKRSCRLSTPVRLGVAAVTACFLAAPLLAAAPVPSTNLPTGFTNLVGIDGRNIVYGANSLDILTSTNRSAADVDKFNIAAGYRVSITQPTVSASVLFRVLSNDPSVIYGRLSSNGGVYLVNPGGIFVGPGGQVDVARFSASTLNITNADFLAGRNLFVNEGTAKDVINQGEITTPAGGSVYLIGSNVSNEGIITTPKGETILAAGATVSLIDSALPGVKVDITGAAGNSTNLGTITAEAGRIGIAGVIVRNSGTLNASSVVNEGGRIFLKASHDAYVDGNGRIVTTGSKGGSVEVLGDRVAVMDNASIDASGTNGGGRIMVGGDFQGKNPDIQNANITYFGPNASLKADATDVGDGGTVIVWADDTTRAYGNISARGGALGGNGGFVETSGHRHLDFGATVDTSAAKGKTGTLLLDPMDVDIGNVDTYYGASFGPQYGAQVFSSATVTNASFVSWATIQSLLGSNNVTITTTDVGGTAPGNIRIVASPNIANVNITHTAPWGTMNNTYYGAGFSSSNNLGLFANGSVYIDKAFGNAGSGAIEVISGWNGSLATPDVTAFASGKNIVLTGVANFSGGALVSKGNVTLRAADSLVLLGAATNGRTGIDLDTGTLTVVADKLLMTAVGTGGSVEINGNGAQTFTIGRSGGAAALMLLGANGGGVYGGYARIDAFGSGTQQFNFLQNAAVTLTGGSGDGIIAPGLWSGSCFYGGCSGNWVGIERSGTGNQVFDFAAGGNINITGGSVGNANDASIWNEGSGTQTIGGAGVPNISLLGGASGGMIYGSAPNLHSMENAAGINSKTGAQVIHAGTITLNGGTATYGGAYLGAPSTTITTTGDLSLTAGAGTSGAALGPYDAIPTDYLFYNAAVIGAGNENASSASINLTVGGNLNLYGGAVGTTGGSLAGIGGFGIPATVLINATGNVTLNSANHLANGIGSFTNAGGSVVINATGVGSSINLGKGAVGTGTAGTVTLAATNTGGTITQFAGGGFGKIGTGVLTASAASNISLLGLNMIGTALATTTNGNIFLNTVKGVNVGTMHAGGAGNISVTSQYVPALAAAAGITTIGPVTADGGWVGLQSDGNVNVSQSVYGGNGAFIYAGVTPMPGSGVPAGASAYGGGNIDIYANITGYGTPEAVHIQALAGSTANSGTVSVHSASTISGTGSPDSVRIYSGGNMYIDGTVIGATGASTLKAGFDLNGSTASTYGGNLSMGSGSSVSGYGGVTIVASSGSTYQASKGFIGLTTLSSSAGPVSVTADRAIYDNNGLAANITATSVSLSSIYGGTAGSLAISADTVTSGSIVGTVSGGASGGIYIRNSGGTPSSVTLSDSASANTSAKFYNDTSYSTYGASPYSLTAWYGGTVGFLSGGDLNHNGGTFNTGGNGKIGLVAVGTLDINSSLGSNDSIALGGATINVAQVINTTGDLAMGAGVINVKNYVTAQNVVLAAGTLNIGNSIGGTGGITATNHLLAVVTGDVNIISSTGFDSYITTTTGDLEMLVGGNLNILGNGMTVSSYIHAGLGQSVAYFPDASIAVGGDLKLNNGAYIAAANDVYLDLLGGSSKLVMNDGTPGYAPSYVLSDIGTGIAATTHVAFATRSSGGIVIDGKETTTTVVGGSGFFAVDTSTPATPGAGLDITYASNGLNDLCAISPTLCRGPDTDPNPPPPPTKPDPGKKASCTPGSFGCDEEDKDKQDQAKDEKKDEKAAAKKIVQCGGF